MNQKADDTDDQDKQKAYEYDVHEYDLSRGRHRLSDSRPRRSSKANDIKSPVPAFYSRSYKNQ
jgi:hypothetical protein